MKITTLFQIFPDLNKSELNVNTIFVRDCLLRNIIQYIWSIMFLIKLSYWSRYSYCNMKRVSLLLYIFFKYLVFQSLDF